MKTFALLFLALFLAVPCFAGRGFAGSDVITINGVGTPVDIATGPMTISFWMFPTVINSAEHDPLGKWGSSAALQQYLLAIGSTAIGPGTEMGFVVGSFSPLSGIYGGCGTLVANQWYHVVLRVDPVGIIFGSPAATMSITGFINCGFQIAFNERRTAGGVNLKIGGQNTGPNFQGTIAELAFWNVPLNDSEVGALHAGVSPNRTRRTSLVAYYPLYGAASPEPDLSKTANNGVLTGTTVAPHCPCSSPY